MSIRCTVNNSLLWAGARTALGPDRKGGKQEGESRDRTQLGECLRGAKHGLTVAWAAISAASMLRPGGPGAQKDTRMWFPASSSPSVACWTVSVISADSYSRTAKPFSCPSCPYASYTGMRSGKDTEHKRTWAASTQTAKSERGTYARWTCMPLGLCTLRAAHIPCILALDFALIPTCPAPYSSIQISHALAKSHSRLECSSKPRAELEVVPQPRHQLQAGHAVGVAQRPSSQWALSSLLPCTALSPSPRAPLNLWVSREGPCWRDMSTFMPY